METYASLRSAMAERDAGFAEVVRRHLHIHAVAHADADEILAHFA